MSYTLLAIYCLGIVGASLLGGVIPNLLRLTHRRLQMALSFVAGAMLGVALFHMLPHAVLEVMDQRHAEGKAFGHGQFDTLTVAMVAGFLAMFLLERFARFHRHEPEEALGAIEADGADGANGGANGHGHEHRHHHGHGHGHAHASSGRGPRGQGLSAGVHPSQWIGALAGLSVHSLLEGIALAASVMAGAGLTHGHDHGNIAGLGVFLVILLHKPFDSMTLLTLFHASESKRAMRRALLLNLLFALVVPLGAAAFCLGVAPFVTSTAIVPLALAFCAGTFLCIASSDLLPELQFHRHDRGALSLSLVLGLALAWAIGLLESDAHHHHHPAPHAATSGDATKPMPPHDHDHDHDH